MKTTGSPVSIAPVTPPRQVIRSYGKQKNPFLDTEAEEAEEQEEYEDEDSAAEDSLEAKAVR